MDITNLGLQETFRGKKWDYSPFVDTVRDVLLPIRESSGDGFRFYHSCRVFQLVSQMRYYPELEGVADSINWPVLKVAALFHDVGVRTLYDRHGFLSVMDQKVLDDWVSTHAELGVSVARAHLHSMLAKDELEEICFLIANHNSYDVEGSVALKLLQDADNLDEKGVQHLYRMATVADKHGRSLIDTCRYFFERMSHVDAHSFSELHFASSKATAHRRLQELRDAVLKMWHQTHGLDIPFSRESFPWEEWDTRIRSTGYVIDRPAGTVHPRYTEIVYPVDYGYLPGVMGWDDAEQDIFVGDPEGPLVGIILTADFHKGDREFKLLWGLNDQQVKVVLNFFNRKPEVMTGMLLTCLQLTPSMTHCMSELPK